MDPRIQHGDYTQHRSIVILYITVGLNHYARRVSKFTRMRTPFIRSTNDTRMDVEFTENQAFLTDTNLNQQVTSIYKTQGLREEENLSFDPFFHPLPSLKFSTLTTTII